MSRRSRLVASALLALSIGFAIAGCDTLDKLNPFDQKQPPLPGTRKPLFPEGVPGVEFGAPPPQPSNSNIPIPAEHDTRRGPAAAGDSRGEVARGCKDWSGGPAGAQIIRKDEEERRSERCLVRNAID